MVVCLACVHLVAFNQQLSWIVVKFSYRFPKPSFFLLCVMSVDSMRVCHDLRSYSEMVFISSSPASTVSSAIGPGWYLCLYYSCFLGCTRYVLMVASKWCAFLASLLGGQDWLHLGLVAVSCYPVGNKYEVWVVTSPPSATVQSSTRSLSVFNS